EELVIGCPVDDVDLSWISTHLFGNGGQPLQSRCQLLWLAKRELGIHTDRIPAIAQFGGATQGSTALPPHPDGWRRFLHRFREERDVREPAVFALEAGIVASPKLFKGANIFVGDLTPFIERRQP